MTDTRDYQAEYEEMERKHTALLDTMTIPDRDLYPHRQLQAQWVEKREESTNGGAITGTSGWTAGCSKEVYELLTEGKAYVLETRGFSSITGWLIDGQWYDRKSDEQLEQERQEWLAKWQREKEETLAKNREDWQKRQDALPTWIRERLESFHEAPDFAADGWGYELAVAELAVMYADLGVLIAGKTLSDLENTKTPEIDAYAHKEGTSGNQHGMALAIAKAHLQDPKETMAGTVSALSPITGKPDYKGD